MTEEIEHGQAYTINSRRHFAPRPLTPYRNACAHLRQHILLPTTAHLRTTIQGAVSGLHWGLGFGLGAMLGGVLYAGLGARRCFAVSAALPSLSLLLLALPTARRWCSGGRGVGDGRRSRVGLAAGNAPSRGRRPGGNDGRSYELVGKVRGRVF